MRGSIRTYKGKKGNSYQIVIELGKDAEGNRKQKVYTFNGKKSDAEIEMRRILSQLDNGTYTDPKKVTLGEYLDQWLADYHAVKKLAPSSYDSYKMIIEKHLKPELGNTLLRKLTPDHIQKYYTKATKGGRKDNKKSTGRGLTSNTVAHHHRLLHLAMATAVKKGLLSYNITDRVDVPKPEKSKFKTLTKDQIDEVLKSLEGHYMYMPVFLAVYTGMRRGEILGLKWENVDLEAGIISVRQVLQGTGKKGFSFKLPKTEGSTRNIKVPPPVIKVLKQHSTKQSADKLSMGEAYNRKWDLVCCLNNGEPINPGTIASRWERLSDKMKLGVRFHDLRHSHATLLLGQGVHAKIVSERLGHSNISITMDLYSHVTPEMREEAAAAIEKALFIK